MSAGAPAYSVGAIRRAEEPLLAAGEPLMARAAAAIARLAREELDRGGAGRAVLVLAGRGGNGGDALYAAAELAREGRDVAIVLTSDGVLRDALRDALAAGAVTIGLDELRDGVPGIGLVIDGIVGLGTRPDAALRGVARAVVSALQAAPERPPVLAIDLPSGVHPDTGAADDVVLPARVTAALGAVSAGLATGRGPALAGRVVLVDLGFDEALAQTQPLAHLAAAPERRTA